VENSSQSLFVAGTKNNIVREKIVAVFALTEKKSRYAQIYEGKVLEIGVR
jgi:hypothetical protein